LPSTKKLYEVKRLHENAINKLPCFHDMRLSSERPVLDSNFAQNIVHTLS
jgi:hypothetical protein